MILPTSAPTPSLFTLLSQNIHGVVRMVQKPHLVTLQAFTGAGFQAVALDDEALLAFLRALPRETVLSAIEQPPAMPLWSRGIVLQEAAPVWHWARWREIPSCDGRNDTLVSLPEDVTCEACLDDWHRQAGPADDDKGQEPREGYQARPIGGA